MFLNENYEADVLSEEVSCNYGFGEAGVHELNYDLSEEYHGLVEAMIIAEHTSIVNEDANLLNEAGNAFFKKVGEIFTKMKNGLISIWNKIKNFFAERTRAIQKKIAAWKVGKVTDLTGRKVTTGATVEFRGKALGQDCLKYAKNALTIAKNVAKSGEADIDPKSEDNLFRQALGLEKSAMKDDTYKKFLTNKWVKDTKKEVEYTVTADMCKFVISYADVVSGIKEAFESAIKAYDELAKKFDALASKMDGLRNTGFKSMDEELKDDTKETSKGASKAAGVCRSISAKLNVALGVATTLVKEQQTIAWSAINKAKAQVKDGVKKPGKEKKDNEKADADVLSTFMI